MHSLLKGKSKCYVRPVSKIEMNRRQTASNIHIKRPVSRVVNQAIYTNNKKIYVQSLGIDKDTFVYSSGKRSNPKSVDLSDCVCTPNCVKCNVHNVI